MAQADPDCPVKILHHTSVKKYSISVVSNKVRGKNLHLVLLEKDLDHDVCQETVPFLMQANREPDNK